MHFLLSPVTLSLLDPNILLSRLFSNTIIPCSSPNVSPSFAHTDITVNIITVIIAASMMMMMMMMTQVSALFKVCLGLRLLWVCESGSLLGYDWFSVDYTCASKT
jgi:hypothetical protein